MVNKCERITVWEYTQHNSLPLDTIISFHWKMEMAHYGSQPFNCMNGYLNCGLWTDNGNGFIRKRAMKKITKEFNLC